MYHTQICTCSVYLILATAPAQINVCFQQEWIHRYEACGEYMKKLNPEDVMQYIDGIVFVEQSLEQVRQFYPVNYISVFCSFGLSTKEPIQSCFVHPSRCQCHCCCLCTGLLTTWLDIKTSYLVQIHTHVPGICTSISSHSDIFVSKWRPFWYSSLICYPDYTNSHGDFVLHTLIYLSSTYVLHTKGIMLL